MKDLEMILNTCLNDAMCKVDRIKQPNSNKIAEFVTNWMQVKKLNIDDVSKCLKFVPSKNSEFYCAKCDELKEFHEEY